jgi:hypothetical protein
MKRGMKDFEATLNHSCGGINEEMQEQNYEDVLCDL